MKMARCVSDRNSNVLSGRPCDEPPVKSDHESLRFVGPENVDDRRLLPESSTGAECLAAFA